MPYALTCPRGHHWDGADPFDACPTCGAAGNSRSDTDSPTLDTGLHDELPPPPEAVGSTVAQIQMDAHGLFGELPTIPGYDILGVLGRGGMGVVYKARHRTLNRVVALKVVKGGAGTSTTDRDRFRTEAEAVAALQHPNIIQIFEVGEWVGLPYCALEYADGGNLDQSADGRPVPPQAAAECVERLARAMQYAHEHGVVHRDLKPANVLLASGVASAPRGLSSARSVTSPRGADATPLARFVPKISDFGLAKRLEHDSGLTGTGAILGTPSYMAPEQASGEARTVGPPADIWALGAILYELLTGRPPFLGPDAVSTILAVRAADPVPPRRLQPNVPADLETIALKCLEKEPGRRYATAGALADDVRRFLAGEPIAARPAGWWERGVKWARRRPTAAALVGVTGVATVVLAVVGANYYRALAAHNRDLTTANETITRERDTARTERQRAEDNLDTAVAAVDQMLTRVGVTRLVGVAHMDPTRAELLADAVKVYDRLLAVQAGEPRLRFRLAHACDRTGSILLMLGRFDAARERFDRALAMTRDLRREATLPAGSAAVARLEALIHNNLGLLAGFAGRPAEALSEHQSALALREDLLAAVPDDAEAQYDVACSHLNLAGLTRAQNRPDLTEQYLTRARERAAEIVRRHPTVTKYGYLYGTVLNDLSVYHLDQDQATRAISVLDEGVAVWRRVVAAEPHSVEDLAGLARCLSNLGTSWRAQGDFDRAAGAYRESRDIRERLARDHPAMWAYQVDLGWSFLNSGLVHRAKNEHTAAIEAFTRAIGHLDRAMAEPAARARARVPLREALSNRATIAVDVNKQHAAGIADLERLIELSDGEARLQLRVARAAVLAHAGQVTAAVAAATELVDGPAPPPAVLFHAGRVFAVAAGREADASRKEDYAVRAVEQLGRAHAAGFFTDQKRRELLDTHEDLAALRGRADFAAVRERAMKKP